VPSLRWLRRLAHAPIMVTGYSGVDEKPLRDCTDEEVRAIVAFHSERGNPTGLFDGDWWLGTMLEIREQDRYPLEDCDLFSLLGLAWGRLTLAAARRSSLVRALLRFSDRIEDRLRRNVEYDQSEGHTQIAFGGSLPPHR
jgi:hypothetical protein